MCLYAKLIYNPKYKPNKKNGGIIPAIHDKRVLAVPTGCGKCIECMKQKARQWELRLTEDIKEHTNAKFVTLTFSNENYKKLYKQITLQGNPYDTDNILATVAVRWFTERWRKQYKKTIRHWLVTELGHANTEHIHLHGLLWTNETNETITKIWNYGYTYFGTYVNGSTINYITKYVQKIDQQHQYYKPIILTSNGIGQNYTKSAQAKHAKLKQQEHYRTQQGYKMPIPNYWKNKIYTEQEKEQLWIQKLDKKERWICGERIDLTKPGAEEQYYKLLEWHRERNKILGYGNDKINWTRKKYELQRRILLQELRTEKTTPSAGSLAKGIRLNNKFVINEETGDVERRHIQSRRSKGVAPAVGCERIHYILNNTVDKLQWNVEKQIWKQKQKPLILH